MIDVDPIHNRFLAALAKEVVTGSGARLALIGELPGGRQTRTKGKNSAQPSNHQTVYSEFY